MYAITLEIMWSYCEVLKVTSTAYEVLQLCVHCYMIRDFKKADPSHPYSMYVDS